jgi:hypothetical protein
MEDSIEGYSSVKGDIVAKAIWESTEPGDVFEVWGEHVWEVTFNKG